jgi:predicted small secreted protein
MRGDHRTMRGAGRTVQSVGKKVLGAGREVQSVGKKVLGGGKEDVNYPYHTHDANKITA